MCVSYCLVLLDVTLVNVALPKIGAAIGADVSGLQLFLQSVQGRSPLIAGLGPAINNTARRTGGAIGIAVAGAVAGRPHGPGFLGGLHTVAVGAAVP